MIVLHRQITFCIFAEGTKYRILEINIDTPKCTIYIYEKKGIFAVGIFWR